MAELYNIAKMTTSTTGTGTITLGSAVDSFLSFAGSGVTNGDVVAYVIEDGSAREIGTGTYTASGTTLTRTVTKSTNSDAAINLSGNATVALTARAEDIRRAASATEAGVVEKATDAEVRAATSNKFLSADLIESASAKVTLTDGANIALDWDAGINFTLTLGGNRTLDNPTNEQVGTWRHIEVIQDGTGSRTLSFGSEYKFAGGTAPTMTTTANAIDTLSIYCKSGTEFLVYSALDWS